MFKVNQICRQDACQQIVILNSEGGYAKQCINHNMKLKNLSELTTYFSLILSTN